MAFWSRQDGPALVPAAPGVAADRAEPVVRGAAADASQAVSAAGTNLRERIAPDRPAPAPTAAPAPTPPPSK